MMVSLTSDDDSGSGGQHDVTSVSGCDVQTEGGEKLIAELFSHGYGYCLIHVKNVVPC